MEVTCLNDCPLNATLRLPSHKTILFIFVSFAVFGHFDIPDGEGGGVEDLVDIARIDLGLSFYRWHFHKAACVVAQVPRFAF
jgi:hypothetical protein